MMQQPSKKISSSDDSGGDITAVSPSPSVSPSPLKRQSKTNNDNRRRRKTQEVINDNDLIVQILSRLDGSSYLFALQEDARTITENNLMPKYFPWNQNKSAVEEEGRVVVGGVVNLLLSSSETNHHKITKTIPNDR